MSENIEQSRRDFLTSSVKMAGVAGLVASAGCAATDPRVFTVTTGPVPAGPTPPPIGPDQKLGLGFIGVGNRGSDLLRSAMLNPNVSVKAFVEPQETRTQDALQKIKEKLGETPEVYHGLEDYKRLLARDDIDAVFLATPCHLHAEMYLACFAAGKHFYGEKPMCLEVAEADALVLAQQKNPAVVAQIGFQRRAMRPYQLGIKAIHDGTLGPLIAGLGAFNSSYGPHGVPGQPNLWFGRRKLSGDWMLEQACHSWDIFNWAAGALPISAEGMGRRDVFKHIDPERDVTDYYVAHLEYPNNFLVSWEHIWFCPYQDKFKDSNIGRFSGPYERVAGLKGGIDLGEGKLYSSKPDAPPIDLCPEVARTGSADEAVKKFFDSLRTSQPPIIGVTEARKATLTGLLVRKAVDERRRVLMTEII